MLWPEQVGGTLKQVRAIRGTLMDDDDDRCPSPLASDLAYSRTGACSLPIQPLL